MTDLPSHVSVAIIGSGFSGLGTAIKLKESGRHDFVILERAHDVGGTWRDNTYPGCACDVPSQVYSFSYALNPTWSRAFSPQPEIYAYLRKVATDRGLEPHLRFGAEVLACEWDEQTQLWTVETTVGTLTAKVVVAGSGGLSEPKEPDIKGLSSFEGTTFHSARWDHSWSAAGRRVAVIGTGASAIQFVPHLQKEAAGLVLFQRTATWVLPRADREIPAWQHKAFTRFPWLQRASRSAIYLGRESHILGFRYNQGLMRLAQKAALKNLHRSVADPVLREKLTPTFTMGCKRVLLSNTYYPALTQPNAHVETDPIVEVVANGVVTEAKDGTRTTHEVDTIVFATGFAVSDPPIAERVHARGRSLKEEWSKNGMQALHGMSVAGFPNFFILVGPNTGLGHNSITLMIEAQVGHLLDALDALEAAGASAIEPRVERQAAYNADLQRQLKKTVWNRGGCSSWYLDDKGRNTTLWPTFTFTFMREVSRFDPSEYHLHRA
ncbi:MAG: FAD-dependent pyridine nucleotide-disulfide oxidoreductase [Frankiales bacterium]|nr:FAD-dependent pyridine nucleotide-disulfide oxidoreductase [Frankiales bacterium]